MKRLFPLGCAVLAAMILHACKSEDTSVIDTSYSTSTPHISTLSLTADALDTGILPPSTFAPDDTVTIHVTVRVALKPGTLPAAITIARVTAYAPSGALLQIVPLRNDGIAPDVTANDSVFTGSVLLSIKRKQIGSYRFAVLIANRDGNEDGRQSAIDLRNSSNHAPVVSLRNIPDTVLVPTTGYNPYLFSVRATDAEGLEDIISVQFDVFRPSGVKTGTFSMYDDGSIPLHGDSTSGDGIYSLIVKLDSANSRNSYNTFKFYAVDRSGAVSDTITKKIVQQ